jgi:hypothetical protein
MKFCQTSWSICITLHRGEEYNPPRIDSNLKQYLTDGAEEYAYLFKDGEWVCYNTRSWDDKFLQQVEIPVAVCA